jgi:hypothetical protein
VGEKRHRLTRQKARVWLRHQIGMTLLAIEWQRMLGQSAAVSEFKKRLQEERSLMRVSYRKNWDRLREEVPSHVACTGG